MKKILLLLLAIFYIYQAEAQNGTGIIRVKVFDAKTGETLIGANVMLAGTTRGATTDLDGVASITSLTPGDYTLQISYISYQPKTINDIHIEKGKTESFDVQLSAATIDLQDVVVTAKAVKNSENAVLTMQKQSSITFDAITADQFAKNSDSDAASALKRVTGVTIASGKYVYVRGLGDRYSKSILNGSEIPGLDPNKNSVQLDLFPTNLIDNIIVYKTFTPDLPGNFTGGLVDINTKDFPVRFNMQVSASAGYNSQVTFNNNFLTAETSSTDFLGFDNGKRSLPAVVSKYEPSDFPAPYIGNQDALTKVSKAFSTSFGPQSATPPTDHGFNFSVGNQVNLFGKPFGFVAGLSYSRKFLDYINGVQNIFEGISQGQTTLDRDILTASREHKSERNTLLGALVNTSYKLNNNNKIGVTLIANHSGTGEARYQEGYRLDYAPDSSVHIQNRALAWTERSFYNGQLRGEHQLALLGGMNIQWASSNTVSKLYQPDVRLVRNNFSIAANSTDTLFNFGNNDRPSRYYRDMQQFTSSSKIDLSIPIKDGTLKKGKFKFGGEFTYKTRDFHENLYDYSIQNAGNFYESGNISDFFVPSLLGYVNGNLENFLQYYSYPDNNYTACQRLYAGYAMVDMHLFPKVKVTTGVRFEKTFMFLRSASDTTGTINTNDFLPSLAATYEINDNTNLRASVTRTLARPSFREFAPLATFDFLGGYIQNGNASLKRTLINNYDLRLEQYPSPGAYFGLSLFYKKFLNPIENAQLPQAGGSGSQFQYVNAKKSQLYGAEFELRKNLGDFFSILDNFKINTNLTYVYSYVNVTNEEYQAISAWDKSPDKTRPMFNLSPYVVNASLTYASANNAWESAIGFNVSGKRLIVYQVDLPSIYLQPRPELNFTIKKQLFNKMDVRFSAENLLNSPYAEQIGLANKVYYTTKYTTGRKFSVSLKYNFN